MDPDRLLFIHIRKTGGASITQAITGCKYTGVSAHKTAEELRVELTPQVFDELIKFTSVRNPYDRVVSYYYYILQNPPHHAHPARKLSGFSEFVDWLQVTKELPTQFSKILIEGKPCTEYILRFENLAQDWANFVRGTKLPSKLRRLNQSHHPPWQEVCSTSDMRKIVEMYEEDFNELAW